MIIVLIPLMYIYIYNIIYIYIYIYIYTHVFALSETEHMIMMIRYNKIPGMDGPPPSAAARGPGEAVREDFI